MRMFIASGMTLLAIIALLPDDGRAAGHVNSGNRVSGGTHSSGGHSHSSGGGHSSGSGTHASHGYTGGTYGHSGGGHVSGTPHSYPGGHVHNGGTHTSYGHSGVAPVHIGGGGTFPAAPRTRTAAALIRALQAPPSAYALTHSYAARYPSPHNATAAAHGFNKLTPARNSIAGANVPAAFRGSTLWIRHAGSSRGTVNGTTNIPSCGTMDSTGGIPTFPNTWPTSRERLSPRSSTSLP